MRIQLLYIFISVTYIYNFEKQLQYKANIIYLTRDMKAN